MGKHKKNKAKENKDKKAERKPIKRAATGHKYILHTHTVTDEHTKNRISCPTRRYTPLKAGGGGASQSRSAHLVTQLYKK